MPEALQYSWTTQSQIHARRRKELMRRHPGARALAGPHASTPVAIAALVLAQLAIAYAVRGMPWWVIALSAYLAGAVLNHALYVMIHECAHNLAFRRPWANRIAGIAADIPLVVPSALSFRKYHLLHHRHLGELGADPDLVTGWEARVVASSFWRKALWMSLFSISQALRPSKLEHVKMWDAWIVANSIFQIAVVDVLVVVLLGPAALVYLLLSTLFALGLHPLGGRWIQEHYVTEPGQETYSYYGLGNLVAFNIGYHNEHHDFPVVPWIHLPKLKRMAPELYSTGKSYRCWTAVLLRFLFDPRMSSYSRIARAPAQTQAVSKAT